MHVVVSFANAFCICVCVGPGHNHFSAMELEEWQTAAFSSLPLDRRFRRTGMEELLGSDQGPPASSVNWTKAGAVTPVKNQGNCGACWAFSATGAMEGARYVKTGLLEPLSEMELVDCDMKASGCGGGLSFQAYEFATQNGGLCSEQAYSYNDSVWVMPDNTTCKLTTSDKCQPVKDSAPKNYTILADPDHPATYEAVLAAVAKTPVSVGVDAGFLEFKQYASGIYDGPCDGRGATNHGVLLTGYGSSGNSGTPFWSMKNSWGTAWGEAGYMRLSRNSLQRGKSYWTNVTEWFGTCSIGYCPSFPIF